MSKRRLNTRTPRGWWLLLAAAGLAAVVQSGDRPAHQAWGKELARGDVAAASDDAEESNNQDEKEFPGGASLKTDPELERLLKRADEFAADGRYDLACVLWQRVLDESAETVMTRDDWTVKTFKRMYRTYKSVTGEIERTLAKLPAEGLKVYRLTADGEAQAILAAGEGDRLEESLVQVTRRYFLSSHGDDAAFKLACLRMDRYDFVGSSRLLAKILEEYPDPSVPREQILARLAVASARVGDRETAKKAVAELKKSGSAAIGSLVELVDKEVGREGVEAVVSAEASEQWPMTLGNPADRSHESAAPVGQNALGIVDGRLRPEHGYRVDRAVRQPGPRRAAAPQTHWAAPGGAVAAGPQQPDGALEAGWLVAGW